MAAPERNFKLGYYKGALRYRSISRWADDLEVLPQNLSQYLTRGGSMQNYIDLRHDTVKWDLWTEFCFG